MLTQPIIQGITATSTARVFRPQFKSDDNHLMELKLAALRQNGITENNFLCLGDSFIEIKLKGAQGEYYVPIDLWDLYQALSQCAGNPDSHQQSVQGAVLMRHLEKVGVSLARYSALLLTRQIITLPKNELLETSLTHHGQLIERCQELLQENFFNLSCTDLIVKIPGGMQKGTFRFGREEVQKSKGRFKIQETQPMIRIAYEKI